MSGIRGGEEREEQVVGCGESVVIAEEEAARSAARRGEQIEWSGDSSLVPGVAVIGGNNAPVVGEQDVGVGRVVAEIVVCDGDGSAGAYCNGGREGLHLG